MEWGVISLLIVRLLQMLVGNLYIIITYMWSCVNVVAWFSPCVKRPSPPWQGWKGSWNICETYLYFSMHKWGSKVAVKMRNSIVWAPWHPLQNSHIIPVPTICYLGNSCIPAAQVAGWLPCGTCHFSGRAMSISSYVQAHCVWTSCLGHSCLSLVTSKLHCV